MISYLGRNARRLLPVDVITTRNFLVIRNGCDGGTGFYVDVLRGEEHRRNDEVQHGPGDPDAGAGQEDGYACSPTVFFAAAEAVAGKFNRDASGNHQHIADKTGGFAGCRTAGLVPAFDVDGVERPVFAIDDQCAIVDRFNFSVVVKITVAVGEVKLVAGVDVLVATVSGIRYFEGIPLCLQAETDAAEQEKKCNASKCKHIER